MLKRVEGGALVGFEAAAGTAFRAAGPVPPGAQRAQTVDAARSFAGSVVLAAARPDRRARGGAARLQPARGQEGAAPALQGLLRGNVGDPDFQRRCRAATATPSTRSATICWCSITMRRRNRGEPAIVGTYQLLRQDVARRYSGFHTANEFDLAPLVERHGGLNFLELGRSCVLAPYRTKRTVELLWHGIWSYVRRHGVDVMIGCASLRRHRSRPAGAAARLPASPCAGAAGMARRRAARPPCRHGQAGARGHRPEGGDAGAAAADEGLSPGRRLCRRRRIVDRQFGTTDVMIVLPVSAINARYVNHYGVDASRYAA